MNHHRLLRRFALVGMILALAAPATASLAQDQDEAPHWEYEGENGPEHWGDLSPDYETCGSGEAQSPVDIPFDAISYIDPDEFPVFTTDYQPSAINYVNNGHTIQFNYDEGSTLSINDEVYDLLQFHFHIPSEHTINGESYPMEMHLVHANEDGDLAVLGIIIDIDEDEPTDVLDLIWSELPDEEGEFEMDGEINAADFLPEVLDILTYSGSLTTPPCTESVTWMLSGAPLNVDQQIVDDFGAIFEFNNRPTQPLNDRPLEASS